jgi:hypothetical protein
MSRREQPPVQASPFATTGRRVLLAAVVGVLCGTCAPVAFGADPGGLLRKAEVHYKAGRYADAALAFEQAMASGTLTPAERARVEAAMRDLKWRLHDDNLGCVDVLVDPPSAQCALDGAVMHRVGARCVAWVRAGSHALTVSAPGHAMHEALIGTTRGERRSMAVRLASTVQPRVVFRVGSVVAVAWMDGNRLGEVTVEPFTVPAGYHFFELRAAGHLAWTKEVTLSNGERLSFDVQFRPEPREPGTGPREIKLSRERPLTDHRLGADGDLPEGRVPTGERLDVGLGRRKPIKDPTPPPEEPELPVVTERHRSGGGSRVLGWITLGAGVAGLGTGGWLYASAVQMANDANALPLGSKYYDQRYDEAVSRALLAAGVGAGGLVLSGLGSWLLLRSGDDSASALWLSPSSDGLRLSVFGRF